MRTQESEADPEKACQENEVREVRQIDDVGAGPSNQGQLNEEHQEAEREHPDSKLPNAFVNHCLKNGRSGHDQGKMDGCAVMCWVSRRSIRRRAQSLAARARTWASFRGSKAFACRLASA